MAIFLAARRTLVTVIGALTSALKVIGKALRNGLKAVVQKAASMPPGRFSSIASLLSKAGGKPLVFWPSTPGW